MSICVHLWFRFLPHDPLKLEPWVLEVENDANPKASDLEIVDPNQACYLVGSFDYGFDCFYELPVRRDCGVRLRR